MTTLDKNNSQNSLLHPFNTPLKVPLFSSIKSNHYLEAFDHAMKEHKEEIAAITNNDQLATFENTIAEFSYSGQMLDKVASIFFCLYNADNNKKIAQIAKEITPKLKAHNDSIKMDAALFKRIKDVFKNKDSNNLFAEQNRLLKLIYKDFVRSGALLGENDKQRLSQINLRLSSLQLEFGENLLAENNNFELLLQKKEELSGLPEKLVQAAFEAAQNENKKGWKFSLHKPSWQPFMQYSNLRNLRQEMFEAYKNRCNNNCKNDNKEIIKEIVSLRLEKANLLGYKSYSEYALEENMAQNPEKVSSFLQEIWPKALNKAQIEATELQPLLKKDEPESRLEPWDWFYYSEKKRLEKFNISDEELRPYFQLEKVQQGVFDVAQKLFGLQFEKRADLPVYHKDVFCFEIKNKDKNHLALLYLDYFPRPGKQQGAWMTTLRDQFRKKNDLTHPIIVNVFNFPKPTRTIPSLLNLDEVLTLFHEFGHALHGAFSDVNYPVLAGTNVPRDFVELPSQFMENWAVEKEVLKNYARHYKTNEPISNELIEKIKISSAFNEGFGTTEYLAASFLDLGWHSISKIPENLDIEAFENNLVTQLGLIPQIIPRYKSGYFAHIFKGGYSSAYYSYIWSAVLDSDAFESFKEKENIFDPQTAQAFKKYILSTGNTQDPHVLYKKFKKAEPSIAPLLKKRGLYCKR